MDEQLGVVSLFSGVGGLEIGLENAGMRSVYQCEIDAHCRQVLEHRWPGLPRWDDVSTLTGREILSKVERADVIAWGSPCQDLSVAGRRAGLGGERSGLFYEGMRIIRELREESSGRYPRISIWENVAGAISSNKGADFGVILDEMAEAGALVVEWRLLDAQFFGVPQRRRRVFVVAVFDSAAAAGCPDPLLSLSEGLRRYPAPSRTPREGVARATPEGVAARGHRMRGFGDYADDDIASAINSRDHKGATDLIVASSDSIISFPTNFGSYAQATEDIAQSMAVKAGPPSVAIPDNTAITLSARDHKSSNTLAVEPFTPSRFAQYEQGVGTLRSNGGDLGGGSETLVTFTKAKRAQTTTDDETRVGGDEPEASFVMRQREGKPGGGKGPLISEERSLTLKAGNDQTLFQPAAPMAVRRLTPLECERLMGWPDDWTRWRADGKEQKDSHRYKQCGNGVASPVTEWIGGIIVRLLGGVA